MTVVSSKYKQKSFNIRLEIPQYWTIDVAIFQLYDAMKNE